jgi:hypothetical protein
MTDEQTMTDEELREWRGYIWTIYLGNGVYIEHMVSGIKQHKPHRFAQGWEAGDPFPDLDGWIEINGKHVPLQTQYRPEGMIFKVAPWYTEEIGDIAAWRAQIRDDEE